MHLSLKPVEHTVIRNRNLDVLFLVFKSLNKIAEKCNISLTLIQITEYKNNIPYISMFRKSVNTQY